MHSDIQGKTSQPFYLQVTFISNVLFQSTRIVSTADYHKGSSEIGTYSYTEIVGVSIYPHNQPVI